MIVTSIRLFPSNLLKFLNHVQHLKETYYLVYSDFAEKNKPNTKKKIRQCIKSYIYVFQWFIFPFFSIIRFFFFLSSKPNFEDKT